ncbi:MAG: alpha/beta hydrolase [Planctomycetota bacterium]|nr:alpha/beta hydrolase [Planctomycetota bacterium]
MSTNCQQVLFRICCPLLFLVAAPCLVSPADPFAAPNDKNKPQIKRGVTYAERGEEKLQSDIYLPPGDGPFPGVLMVHGGAWRTGERWHMHRDAEALAENGYTVVNISYRLAPRHKFPAQIEDCREALRWMRTNARQYKINPGRIGGYGYSAGGHLVALLGTADDPAQTNPGGADRPSARLQAVVAGGAPCDFNWIGANSPVLAYWLGKTRGQNPEVYRLASPLTFVTRDDPPMFFYHGAIDVLVPKGSPTRMRDQLKQMGVRSELLLLNGSGHIAAFLSQKALPQAIEFLNDVLKGDNKLKGGNRGETAE